MAGYDSLEVGAGIPGFGVQFGGPGRSGLGGGDGGGCNTHTAQPVAAPAHVQAVQYSSQQTGRMVSFVAV